MGRTGALAVLGLVAVLHPAPARSQEPPPAPSTPAGLKATPVTYGRIDLTWTDTATNEDGFQIERRQGQTGAWATIDTIAANGTSYIDDSSEILPQTEYCYRVIAFDANGASASTESCTTTLAIPPISCTPDTDDAQESLTKILTSPHFADWREEVGLSNADPSMLVLVTDDSICQKIWVATHSSPPGDEYLQKHAPTFWQIGGLYIMRADLVAEDTSGYSSTRVVTSEFNRIGTTLAF